MSTLPFRLYVISDRARMGADPPAAVRSLMRAGLRAFQWREKDLSPAESYTALESIAAELPCLDSAHSRAGRASVHPYADRAPQPWEPPGCRLFVNDRADLALALGLDLHLAEASIPTAAARKILHPGTLVGRSTHSGESARRAEAGGADFVTFGPVYDTPSKRVYGPAQGVEALREVCKELSIPVFALGGVTLERVGACREAGAYGVAVIGAVWDAEEPVAALEALVRACGDPITR